MENEVEITIEFEEFTENLKNLYEFINKLQYQIYNWSKGFIKYE